VTIEGGEMPPPPNVTYQVLNATVQRRYLGVQLYFGTDYPDASLREQAQAELDRLELSGPAMTQALDEFGIRMSLAAGWNGKLSQWAGGAERILQAATVPIQDPYDGQSAWQDLGPDDVFILLAESNTSGTSYPQTELPIGVQASDRCDTCEILDDGTHAPQGHARYHRTFEARGRSFDLYVQFGVPAPPASLFQEANLALSALEIDADPVAGPS
jgi:hypothetical protein